MYSSAYVWAKVLSHMEERLGAVTVSAWFDDAEVVEQGSSYKLCLIAVGTFDYYVRTTHTSEWDTAAGELILHEAGGTTYIYPSGEPLAYNKELLDNPWFVARRLTRS